MALLPREGVSDDCLACQVVSHVDLQADGLADTLLPPVDLDFEVSVVKGDLREGHRWALTHHVGLVLASPRLVIIVHLTSQCLCLRGIEVEGNRRGGEGLVLAIVVQLTRLGVVDSYQAFDEVIVAVCHRAIVWSGVIVVDGEEEAERVVIDLASLLVAELLAYETFVALLLKLP